MIFIKKVPLYEIFSRIIDERQQRKVLKAGIQTQLTYHHSIVMNIILFIKFKT